MPKIDFILLLCQCGASYRVRLAKVAAGEPFECTACGQPVETAPYTALVQDLAQYSALVAQLEVRVKFDGDTVAPLKRLDG